MKRIKYLLFTLLLSICSIDLVSAKDLLTFNKEHILNDTTYISDLTSTNESTLVVDILNNNTYIRKYDSNYNLISSIELLNLSNTKIINYNDKYIVVGLSNSILKYFVIDSNLTILNSFDTTDTIDLSSSVNLYNYDNNVYILFRSKTGTLSNSNLYKIDTNYNLTKNIISTYNPDELKSILKSDYYIMHRSGQFIDNKTSIYVSSTSIEDSYVLSGYKEDNTFNKIGLITLLDNTGIEIWSKELTDIVSLESVVTINDKIVVLANKKDNNSYLTIFDKEGNIEKEILAKANNQDYKLTLIKNLSTLNIVENYTLQTAIKPTIKTYTFDCNINIKESFYGDISIPENANPNEVVTFSIKPNTSYELKEVIVKDSEGNNVPVEDNSFVMPANSVDVTAVYDVKNPETADNIVFYILAGILILLVFTKVYKKYKWLR